MTSVGVKIKYEFMLINMLNDGLLHARTVLVKSIILIFWKKIYEYLSRELEFLVWVFPGFSMMIY